MTPRQLGEWLLRPMVPAVGDSTPAVKQDTKTIVYNINGSPLYPNKPDVLVEIGRDMSDALWRHPEQFQRSLFGIRVLVVDDAAYEGLFYLYSGMTTEDVRKKTNTIISLMFNDTAILSHEMYGEIIQMGPQ